MKTLIRLLRQARIDYRIVMQNTSSSITFLRLFILVAALLTCTQGASAQSSDAPQYCGHGDLFNIAPPSNGISARTISFSYNSSHARCMNNHTVIACTYWEGSTLNFNDKEYSLRSFSVYTPSNLDVDSKSFPLEIALEHQASDGEALVLSVTIAAGKNNPALDTFVQKLPTSGAMANIDDQAFQMQALLASIDLFFFFEKYSKVDKCFDTQQRLVSAQPIFASPEQIKSIVAKFVTTKKSGSAKSKEALKVERVTVLK